ncbi:MAG: GNAT family N-acetyltransferase [Verrucomicrobia subdivision 3 bacterium]|nr:GNAT family N-acetyltransferase [Limisphaerales bacterium]
MYPLRKYPVGRSQRRDLCQLDGRRRHQAQHGLPSLPVICFVVPSEYRGQGVARALLAGAVAYARSRGAKLIEAYPVDKPTRSHDDFMWFGAKSMYDKAGFSEVARRKPHRPEFA